MKKSIVISILIVLLIFSFIYYLAFYPLLQILNGYTAKRICSSHFIAERKLADIEQQDLVYPATWVTSAIDIEHKIVHSSILSIANKSAQYRPGFGCTIKLDTALKVVPDIIKTKSYLGLWPYGNSIRDTIYNNIDYENLSKSVAAAFGTPDRTRAVIVAHKGNIIAEEYAEGFDENTEVLGWSMTKSITNNLVGLLVKQGKLSIYDSSLLKEWQDDRKEITLNNLLCMSTDLDWNEEGSYLSDVTRMLFLKANASDYAIDKQIRQEIGSTFIYSSGTTNIISEIIKNTFETEEAYLKFPHAALFNKLGINATMELDGDNNYIMSSYAYMTTRDWAKLGQFWLQEGIWQGEHLLPKNWIKQSTTAGGGVNSIYGAHFWLNTDSFLYPNVPPDLFAARGFQGQQVIVIPSRDIVIVRFGVDEGLETFNFDNFISSILASIK